MASGGHTQGGSIHSRSDSVEIARPQTDTAAMPIVRAPWSCGCSGGRCGKSQCGVVAVSCIEVEGTSKL